MNEITTTLDERTEQCPDGRTDCTNCPFRNGGYCQYFDMAISQVDEYLQEKNRIVVEDITSL